MTVTRVVLLVISKVCICASPHVGMTLELNMIVMEGTGQYWQIFVEHRSWGLNQDFK